MFQQLLTKPWRQLLCEHLLDAMAYPLLVMQGSPYACSPKLWQQQDNKASPTMAQSAQQAQVLRRAAAVGQDLCVQAVDQRRALLFAFVEKTLLLGCARSASQSPITQASIVTAHQKVVELSEGFVQGWHADASPMALLCVAITPGARGTR
nr:hypothetical protein [Pseudomonas sp. B11D7D]